MKESFEEKNSRKLQTKPRQPKSALIRNIAILVLSVAFLVTGVTMVYAESLLGRINTVVDESTAGDNPFEQTSADPGTIVESKPEDHPEADDEGLKKVGGLWHDDMIANILVMGVDDYQPNDPGRTDSMMLVTIDTRHQQLKVTSFMRDMYVNIPGYGANRINTAYTYGGPKLTVQTLESLFGVDIDRYVCVNVAQFRDIINTLGGVTIELTQAEADLINENSGESYERWVSEGTQRLTGKQAWYYARIRAIGNDQARTERQRKVIESVVDNLKSKDLFTLNSILAQVLGQMSTNMSRNEVLALVANAMTYLNYPIESTRLPVDGTYNGSGDWVYIGGLSQNVIIPDLQANSEHLVEFLYEDDIPEKIR